MTKQTEKLVKGVTKVTHKGRRMTYHSPHPHCEGMIYVVDTFGQKYPTNRPNVKQK